MLLEVGKIDIRPYMKKELAVIYNMETRAFYAFIKHYEEEIGKKKGKYYNVHQVEKLINCIGLPRSYQFEKQKKLMDFI
jgi:hypothetical protein